MNDSTGNESRAEIGRRGRQVRESLGLGEHVHDAPAAGWPQLSDELVFGTIWSRPGLELGDRMAATLPVLCALGREQHIAAYAASALRIGLEPLAVQELFIQAGLYAGFGTAEIALRLCAQVLSDAATDAAATAPTLDALHASGEAKMMQLHGDRATAGYADPAHQTTAALYQIALRYGYGEFVESARTQRAPAFHLRRGHLCRA